MATTSVKDSCSIINPTFLQEDNLLELIEKAQALAHVLLQQDLTAYSAKTLYHYLWVLSDVMDAIYTHYDDLLRSAHPSLKKTLHNALESS